jgi:hypothetical protein
LFECYVPKIEDLYWFAPRDLQLLNIGEEEKECLEDLVPSRYTIQTMIEVEYTGLRVLENKGKIPKLS